MHYELEEPVKELEISGIYMLIYIRPKTKANRENMLFSLKKIEAASKNLIVYTNENAKEIIVAGMGEKHLDNIINELVNQYGIELTVVKRQPFYKETIKNLVQAEGRYIKQASCIGAYGHCWIEISPKERDTASEFINNICDDKVIPKKYIYSVESGIKYVMMRGSIGNFQISDIKVTLYDGSYHSYDSSNMSFKIAAFIAFKNCLKKTETYLLEPFMKMHIKVHEKNINKITNDIINKRGKIINKENNNQYCEIFIVIPLSEVIDKPKILFDNVDIELLSEEFSHYDEIPNILTKSIVDKYISNDYYYCDLDTIMIH